MGRYYVVSKSGDTHFVAAYTGGNTPPIVASDRWGYAVAKEDFIEDIKHYRLFNRFKAYLVSKVVNGTVKCYNPNT